MSNRDPIARTPLHAALAANLAAVRDRVESAAAAAGRSDRPHLVAITKSVAPAVARALVEVGQLDLGENRQQVLGEKVDALRATPPVDAAGAPLRVRWHFVGHLQRNKAARVLELCDLLHSVDSPRLLETLVGLAAGRAEPCPILLQVKLWPEESKGGFDPTELDAALDAAFASEGLEPLGFMTIAPLVDDPSDARAAAREVFGRCAELARVHADRPWPGGRARLSMGMSDDLEEAIEAGSDWLRVGRALFAGLPSTAGGPRP